MAATTAPTAEDSPTTGDEATASAPDDSPTADEQAGGSVAEASARLDTAPERGDDTGDGPAATPEVPAGPTVRVLGVGLVDSSRQRLQETGRVELLEDGSEPADLVAVSTRLARGHLIELLPELASRPDSELVVVVHAGGEATAADVLSRGATGLVAEGNEEALIAIVTGEASEPTLLETYDDRRGSLATAVARDGRDPVTTLPGLQAFEARLAECNQANSSPRIGFVRVANFDDTTARLSAEAASVLRRRLATHYSELGRAAGAEIFALDRNDFGIVAPGLSQEEAQHLGEILAAATATYSPSGARPLSLAVGHAGPDATAEITAVRELAQRALHHALSQTDGGIVSADELSRTFASATELESALRLVDLVERDDPVIGHGERVADLAASIARALGFDGTDRVVVRLAGHLHDIGKVALPSGALGDPERLTGDDLDAYRTHPERAAHYLLVPAGAEVAAAVRHHHETWDGSGFPDGLAESDIPLAARMIAVADACDRWEAAGENSSTVIERLHESAGTRFDPTVVEATIEVLSD